MALMVILPQFRNCGYSYGLQYPYVYGAIGAEGRWYVWHRGTGEVVEEINETNPALNQYKASALCHTHNNITEPPDIGAIDFTP
jgi:hypothetical protein